ncbi:2,4-dienoyl-CoA reductase [Desulfuromonas soudanensis]|uniref:2,4-dienoyl-CoA reductase n=1 Tax=Desulfuromonas soudanensis TaxID=1603606 RepID=A0A0M4DF62_9BACT|nr:NADH:flavin oxidoreductase [Desulfuromonas soudanensis]ALC15095.1 2,4-dienoyl-CoA reductase [Desulfuromonas soudanensis]
MTERSRGGGKGPDLFSPGRIGTLTLANRLVRSATWEGMAETGGKATKPLAAFYRTLAAGGAGLIVSGFASVSSGGKAFPGTLGIDGGADLDGLRRMTDGVHAEGGKIVLQLSHGGGQCRAAHCGGRPVAPSEIAALQYPELPRALTEDEIAGLVEAFAAAADRAQKTGFDGVQLQAAHGYLISQFLSPHTNLRLDRYGGDAEGRSRFLLEILGAIRARVGSDYPLLAKLNLSDNLPGGLTVEEGIGVAQALVRRGIDAIEVSSGTPASGGLGPIRPVPEGGEAYNRPLAEALRDRVGVPLILVGGIRSLAMAAGIVEEQSAAFVALSRPFICQPDLVRRWERGEDPVVSCVSCNACFKAALKGGITCLRSG